MEPLPKIGKLDWPADTNDAGVYEVPGSTGVDILRILHYTTEQYASCRLPTSDAGTND